MSAPSGNPAARDGEGPCPPSAYKEDLRRWLGEEVGGRGPTTDRRDEDAIGLRVFGA